MSNANHLPSRRPEDRRHGLGTLLRHLTELIDRGSQRHYEAAGLAFRPRYTPILRALGEQALTVSDLCEHASVTQSAISQTLNLMERDGLIQRVAGDDRRSKTIRLSAAGRELHSRLIAQWNHRFAAIEALEAETGHPLRAVLADAIRALERKSFTERIMEAQGADSQGEDERA